MTPKWSIRDNQRGTVDLVVEGNAYRQVAGEWYRVRDGSMTIMDASEGPLLDLLDVVLNRIQIEAWRDQARSA